MSSAPLARDLRDLRDPRLQKSALQQSHVLRFVWPPPWRAAHMNGQQKASVNAVVIVLRHLNSFLLADQRESDASRQADASNPFLAYSWLNFPPLNKATWQEWRSAWEEEAHKLVAPLGDVTVSFFGIMEQWDAMIANFWSRPWFQLLHPCTPVRKAGQQTWELDKWDLDDEEARRSNAQASLLVWDVSGPESLDLGQFISGQFGDCDGAADGDVEIARCFYPRVLRVHYLVAEDVQEAPGFSALRTITVQSPRLDVLVDEDGSKSIGRVEREERYNLVAVVRLGGSDGCDAVRVYDQLSRQVRDPFSDGTRQEAAYLDDSWALGEPGQSYMLYFVLTRLKPMEDAPEIVRHDPRDIESMRRKEAFFAEPDDDFDRIFAAGPPKPTEASSSVPHRPALPPQAEVVPQPAKGKRHAQRLTAAGQMKRQKR